MKERTSEWLQGREPAAAAAAAIDDLLSKWSCLCLKVDCRLVLSLETGALISEWLCWLSFSSISSVQQEKPCKHTFNGAPAPDMERERVRQTVREP